MSSLISGVVALVVGLVVLIGVIYIVRLGLESFPNLPPNMKQILLAGISLIGFLILIAVVLYAFGVWAGFNPGPGVR